MRKYLTQAVKTSTDRKFATVLSKMRDELGYSCDVDWFVLVQHACYFAVVGSHTQFSAVNAVYPQPLPLK